MKNLAIRTHAWLISRTGDAERGDSPIPTSIIIAGLAVFAVAVVATVVATGQGFLDKLSTLK